MKTIAIAITLILLTSYYDAANASSTLVHTLNDPTPKNSDAFGASVSLDGNFALVGASGHKSGGLSLGQAHLFDVGSGNLIYNLNDPTPTTNDYFGYSVDIDNGYIVVGATGDDTLGNAIGQAHIFEVATGNLLFTLNDPSPTTADRFGASVGINGNNIIVGAPGDDSNGTDDGQAYLFDATSGNLLQTFSAPASALSNQFGVTVALDGNNVLIGSPYDNSDGTNVGRAYLYDAVSGNLLHTLSDPTITGADNFGVSLDIEGSRILVGARHDSSSGVETGQAHLFDTLTGNLLETFNDPSPTDFDWFGSSVALNGNHVLIGARYDENFSAYTGSAHLFNITSGNLIETFNDPTNTGADDFGVFDNIALENESILIGAAGDRSLPNNSGQAHLFVLDIPEPSSAFLIASMGTVIICLRYT